MTSLLELVNNRRMDRDTAPWSHAVHDAKDQPCRQPTTEISGCGEPTVDQPQCPSMNACQTQQGCQSQEGCQTQQGCQSQQACATEAEGCSEGCASEGCATEGCTEEECGRNEAVARTTVRARNRSLAAML